MIKIDDLLNRFEKIHENRYDYSSLEYFGMLKKSKIVCKIHGIFEQTPNSHLSGSGCPRCNSVKLNKEDLLMRFEKIHENKYDYSSMNFLGVDKKIIIICKKHGKFEQKPSHHLNGQKCPYCVNKKWNNQIFIEKSNEVHFYRYDYSRSKYLNSHTTIEIICKEHGSFFQAPMNHINLKQGCPYCAKNKTNMCEIKKKFFETHENLYEYSDFKYLNLKQKISIICKKHGEFEQNINNHINGQGCPRCRETKGEREIRNYFDENNISYVQYKRFDRCRNKNPLPFDFYLPDYNCCIEFDGVQHFKSVLFFGGDDNLKYIKKLDKIKIDYCLKNEIDLFRIKYDENIIYKLKEMMKNIFIYI